MSVDTLGEAAKGAAWRAGHDAGPARRWLTPRRRELAISVFSPLAVLAAWEGLARGGLLDARFFPAPTSIVGTFVTLLASGELGRHVAASATRLVAGYLLGAIPALLLGLVLGLAPLARAFATPIIFSLYPIPKVAILPLIMLIFGLGELSKWVTVAIGVFFLVLVPTMAGVLSIDRIYFDVARNFNASRLDLYGRVVWPGALPHIVTGLKVASGVALIVLVTAEFVGAPAGVGVLIFESWQVFAIERLYAGLITISCIGYVLSFVFDELERRLIPWRGR